MSELEEARKRLSEMESEVRRLEAIEREHPGRVLARAALTYAWAAGSMRTRHDPLPDLEKAAREYVSACERMRAGALP